MNEPMNEPMTHAEATELAGLYVLDALEPAERAQVDAHLATCAQAHDDFAAVGGVAPALASLADPVGAPASLKNKVLADYRAGAYTGAHSPAAPVRPARQSWLGWAAAAAAVLLIGVTASWAYVAQSRADTESQRSVQIASAIDAMAQPDSTVAFLSGTGTSVGSAAIHGFAAVRADGAGYLVMTGLSAAPAGKTYQVWYLVGGAATSAGLLKVDADGYAVLDGFASAVSANLVALTVEPAGGSGQPTTDPFAVGELRSKSTAS